jgi:hypothetical protein
MHVNSVEHSMNVLPRHVICILGRWSDFSDVETAVAACGDDFTLDREYSRLSPVARMPLAFDASQDRFNPTITDDDWTAIRSHTAVAYILSPPIYRPRAMPSPARTAIRTFEVQLGFHEGRFQLAAILGSFCDLSKTSRRTNSHPAAKLWNKHSMN